MLQDNSGNNICSLTGKIVGEPVFSHEVFNEGFYNIDLEVPRLSQAYDVLPVTVSERIMDRSIFTLGSYLRLTGQIRSYNNYVESEGRNRLIITVFARDYDPLDEEPPRGVNEVFLNGYICKQPMYRTTPFGREIADLLVAVNRSYNKSDYIPCITWGRNARFSGKLNVSDNIKLWGRMQSRGYQKKYEDGTIVDKTAYEVSVSKIEVPSSEEDGEEENYFI
ncbi:MAG: single-stranded DNA-binding protein [Clostridiales bacterium]|nr:single-stranded DNA-binding protein [Clostridiales bacterium]